MAVCRNVRILRCELLMGKAYYGRFANKRSWFYGLQVQAVATNDGVPIEFHIYAASESENTGRRSLPLSLPTGSLLYTDAGYTNTVAEDLFS